MEPTIYLNFKGNCLEAMTFYATLLGGEVTGVFRNADSPDPASRMPGGDDLVMNMAIRLGQAMIMASDVPEAYFREPQGFSISVTPASMEEAERVFAALAEGARAVTMPLGETFWAERFAMVTDRFGTPWMINFVGNRAPA